MESESAVYKDVNNLAGALNRPEMGYFLDVYDSIKHLISENGMLVDIGHGKNLEFPARIAQIIGKFYPQKDMVYYDTSDAEIIRGWLGFLSGAKRAAKKKAADLATEVMKIAGDWPEKLRFANSSAELTGKASEAVLFFTWHHFNTPTEALGEAYSLLKEGGHAIVIDYDLKKHIFGRSAEEAEAIVRAKFTTKSERGVIEREKEWIDEHTKWGAEDCETAMRDAGFGNLEIQVYGDKIFSCVGRK